MAKRSILEFALSFRQREAYSDNHVKSRWQRGKGNSHPGADVVAAVLMGYPAWRGQTERRHEPGTKAVTRKPWAWACHPTIDVERNILGLLVSGSEIGLLLRGRLTVTCFHADLSCEAM